MSKKTALVLGDTTQAHWHFMNAAEPYIRETLEENYELTFSEAYPDMTAALLNQYDLVINYADNWGERGTVPAGVALLDFVANGGQLLTIHSGIITPNAKFLLQMHGGKFLRHADYATLNYKTLGNHPVTEGVGSFSMGEEPYEYELALFSEREPVLEFELNGTIYPAGWVIPYGLGRIVYLQPGHDARSFAVPEFQKLIKNSALWLCPTI